MARLLGHRPQIQTMLAKKSEADFDAWEDTFLPRPVRKISYLSPFTLFSSFTTVYFLSEVSFLTTPTRTWKLVAD